MDVSDLRERLQLAAENKNFYDLVFVMNKILDRLEEVEETQPVGPISPRRAMPLIVSDDLVEGGSMSPRRASVEKKKSKSPLRDAAPKKERYTSPKEDGVKRTVETSPTSSNYKFEVGDIIAPDYGASNLPLWKSGVVTSVERISDNEQRVVFFQIEPPGGYIGQWDRSSSLKLYTKPQTTTPIPGGFKVGEPEQSEGLTRGFRIGDRVRIKTTYVNVSGTVVAPPKGNEDFVFVKRDDYSGGDLNKGSGTNGEWGCYPNQVILLENEPKKTNATWSQEDVDKLEPSSAKFAGLEETSPTNGFSRKLPEQEKTPLPNWPRVRPGIRGPGFRED